MMNFRTDSFTVDIYIQTYIKHISKKHFYLAFQCLVFVPSERPKMSLVPLTQHLGLRTPQSSPVLSPGLSRCSLSLLRPQLDVSRGDAHRPPILLLQHGDFSLTAIKGTVARRPWDTWLNRPSLMQSAESVPKGLSLAKLARVRPARWLLWKCWGSKHNSSLSWARAHVMKMGKSSKGPC